MFRIFGRLPHVGIEGGKPNGVGGYFWRRILNVSFYFASAKLLHHYKMKLKAAGCRLVYKVIDERTIVSVNTVGKQEHSAVYNQAKKR